MTPRIVVRPAADRDLDEQAECFVAQGSPETAERWLAQTAQSFEFLAAQPGIGALRESRKSGLQNIRTWPVNGFEKHIIFFRPTPDGIEVLRVLHGARDIDRILGDA